MSSISGISGTSTADLLKQKSKIEEGGVDFAEHLKSALNEVNELQQNSEVALGDMATGQVKDLHQAALAIGKAETSMKLMLEIRNKALSAYKELGRTQI
ncbi:MAG: flagellar hook-basal body complex protein FliE [Sulfurimonas sp. RIFOXYD12_FULL_33_39]|uniref:flagellar hook-basal body complex protein FliE n=1 Tax=unclassified Sulfurimonas TaxID=2623549 RepID=UPI0008B5274F|nr:MULTISPECIES: flagellar hook-basal body complex protein FliE [unclassified Sulfurimonas]OHE10433.1 MAG: flagellar hook-basal body complex protein FliE [Sulfurimonas sp. RIFOXYD12_FULL_33_39]OHE14891.1 MAG: flagellar hook-basal body complex protein FliE [Sulfurimonas sp. RIFOXYD2_FULL_34_21]DAB27391.1 MAG TPA: flagellar hook-basal body complex protein FliE [Sulfurimonas sp. UBA10385]